MSCVIQSLLGFDASLRMLSVSARPDPRSAAAIRRSSGPTVRHGSELGKAAFHWFQMGGEESDRLRSASRTATSRLGPHRDLDERLNGRVEARRSGMRAPATVAGASCPPGLERSGPNAKAPLVRRAKGLKKKKIKKKGGCEGCCVHCARPGQKGKFTAKLTTKLRFHHARSCYVLRLQ